MPNTQNILDHDKLDHLFNADNLHDINSTDGHSDIDSPSNLDNYFDDTYSAADGIENLESYSTNINNAHDSLDDFANRIENKLDAINGRVFDTINDISDNAKNIKIASVASKICSIAGTQITAYDLGVKIGELCRIFDPKGDFEAFAEVVAIREDKAILLPYSGIHKISQKFLVARTSQSFEITISDSVLGAILDGFGREIGRIDEKIASINDLNKETSFDVAQKTRANSYSIDNQTGSSNMSYNKNKQAGRVYEVMQTAPDPLQKPIIDTVFETGIKAIDSLITCGVGQRMAIFAPAGVGKTTLMGMIARNAVADIIVVCLVGERGREVMEFVSIELDSEIAKRCVLIVTTSDKPPIEQIKCAYVGHTIAEYFRDQGKRVLLFVDSITRFARAQREVGLSAGEPAIRGGFTPSTFLAFPKLLERTGSNKFGSITAFYTVLMETENLMDDPIADEIKSIVDGHIFLSRKVAERSQYPAIDVLASISRIADRLVSEQHLKNARRMRLLVSKYREVEFLLKIGEYQMGNDILIDEAVEKQDNINKFLAQDIKSKYHFSDTVNSLRNLVG